MRSPTKRGRGAVAKPSREPFVLGGTVVAPGTRATIDLPLSLLSDHTPITLTVQVIHGARPGPTLIINGAVHGDEVNGVEIIRRVLRHSLVRRLAGTLIAVPIVNVYGFLTNTRYLPDRRDLNRSFPGSPAGSLASRLAHLFMSEIVTRGTHGIDLHTAAIHRSNFPQIRCDLSNPEVRKMAMSFGVPVVLNAALRDGSLRKAAIDAGIPFLVYEAGEALRFDEVAIRAGVKGIIRVMGDLGMIRQRRRDEAPAVPVISRSSVWVRAPEGGIFRARAKLGARVITGSQLGTIASPFGDSEFPIDCPTNGIVIGRNNLPNVNQGDGIFNIARVDDPEAAADAIDIFQDDWEQS
ncbi:MAG: succinylglutamate desuccinylase/aspartoacylase family protein [Rhodospirillales bacterium]|nr:succinylglutamate desuccinylase/aspartoacylase family protein [Rhodospirillales bacterium]